ncbi:MAG: DUF488 family protein [candidate division NC10 bacterium]|nr:DUF488 family protein [candidate division NC10 bacterium]
MVRIKRVYDEPNRQDGLRILVDRLWPRGLKRTEARIDEWRWDLAPTAALRKWFRHDPKKWDDFQRRYRHELKTRGKLDALQELANRARQERITLLFGARDEDHNNAVVLKDLLEELLG